MITTSLKTPQKSTSRRIALIIRINSSQYQTIIIKRIIILIIQIQETIILLFKITLMEALIQDSLVIIKKQVGEFFNIMMVMYTKANSKMIILMVMENILMEIQLFIMEIGLKILNLELDTKFGAILHNIREIIIMGKKMELAVIYGKIKHHIKESGKIII